MNNSIFVIAIFWGVWIIIPVVFDGLFALIYMLTIIIKAPKSYRHNIPLESLPKVSIIIPTYNEEENINECLNYLKIQSYPQEKMEILVVDNGSTDRTSAIVKEHMREIWRRSHNQELQDQNGLNGNLKVNGQSYKLEGFKGVLRLIVRYEKGKAKALNTGIGLAGGDIIINIDSRSFLAPDAVYNMVAKFVEHPEYHAATGNIEIDWHLIYERDIHGRYILDSEGNYKPRELSHKEKFLAKSQFLEYLTSFRIGRQFQDVTGSMYTFSGAFTAYKRDILLKSSPYRSRTVSEDTDLTLDLQGKNIRLGFCEDAIAYLKPVVSFEKFYAQRVRWHRGQIEVVGLHLDWYGNLRKGFWRNFWLGFLLMVDHTFGFPRLIWMFILPLLWIFGYSLSLILIAILLMYILYIFIDFTNSLYCFRLSSRDTKEKIKSSIQYCLVTPLFRLITFYFRFAAYIEVLKEPQSWSTAINPVRSVKKYEDSLKQSYNKGATFGEKLWEFITGKKTTPSFTYEEKIAEQDTFGEERGDQDQLAYKEEVVEGRRMDGLYDSNNYKEK